MRNAECFSARLIAVKYPAAVERFFGSIELQVAAAARALVALRRVALARGPQGLAALVALDEAQVGLVGVRLGLVVAWLNGSQEPSLCRCPFSWSRVMSCSTATASMALGHTSI